MSAQFPSSVVAKGENQLHNVGDLNISQLSSAISGTPSTFDVDDATNITGWPTSDFVVRIDKELIYCSSRSGNTITVGTRGFADTTSSDHTSGSDVRVVNDEQNIDQVADEIIALQDTLKGNTQASLTLDGDFTVDNTNGSGNLNVDGVLNMRDDGNIQSSGTDAIQLDGNQNVDIPNGTLTLQSAGSLVLPQSTADYTVSWNDPSAARALTVPDPGSDDTFVFLSASQTLTSKTLTSATLNTDLTLNQTTANYTVSWNDPSAARALTVEDAGGDATFMYTDQGQTISAGHTVTGTYDFSGGGFNFPTATTPSPTTEGRAVWDSDDDELKVGNGSSTTTLSTSPGGSDTQLQYNNGGSFGGVAEFTYDDGASTFSFGVASQDYTWDGNGAELTLRAQSANTLSRVNLEAQTADGGDDVDLRTFAVGTAGGTDTESLRVGYDAGGTEYLVQSEAAGTGSHRPIKIESGGNTDQFVLATSGFVGIGQATSSGSNEKFSVNHTGDRTAQLKGTDSNAYSASGEATPEGAHVVFRNVDETDTALASHVQLETQRGANTQVGYVGLVATSTSVSSGELVFGTRTGTNSGEERMRITSNGNVGIGTSSLTDKLHVAGDIQLQVSGTATGTTLVVASNDSTEQAIQRDSSTLRHKENVTPVTTDTVNPSDVLNIDPIHYTRNGEPEVGFGAEHFTGIGLDDGMAWVDGDVTGFLAGSRVIDAAQHVVLQDHDARIEDTEDRVEQLEAEVEVLRETLEEHDIPVPEAAE